MKKRLEIKYAMAVLVFGAAVVLIHFIIAQKSQRALARMTEVHALEILIINVESSTRLLTYDDGEINTLTAQMKKIFQAYESSSDDIFIAAHGALQNSGWEADQIHLKYLQIEKQLTGGPDSVQNQLKSAFNVMISSGARYHITPDLSGERFYGLQAAKFNWLLSQNQRAT